MSIVLGGIADATGMKAYVCTKPFLDDVIGALLSNIDFDIDHRKTFEGTPKTHGHTIQYEVEEGVVFISAATEGFPQRICFAFLVSLKEDWFGGLNEKSKSKVEKYLEGEMEYFSTDPEADKIRNLLDKVEDVSSILQENMETLLARQERTETMQTKAEVLQEKSIEFEKTAEKTRCHACWQYWCMCCTCCGLCQVLCRCCSSCCCIS